MFVTKRSFALIPLLLLAACGSDPVTDTDAGADVGDDTGAGSGDTGGDAGGEDTGGEDAGSDAAEDTATDSGTDGATDTGSDGGTDTVEDTGGDAGTDAAPDADPDAVTDAGGDAVSDTGSDTAVDVVDDTGPAVCGDGVRSGDEACDDGNDEQNDSCRNDCTLPVCGDGELAVFEASVVLNQPIVTNPGGVTGHVCDDGSSCFVDDCDVSEDGSAPEHGICQALGYAFARSVTWGGGTGENDTTMPHAYNWECVDFECAASDNPYSADNCSISEMLLTITCELPGAEDCDEGAGNSDDPGATCRTDCTLARCGDGITDPTEECDDDNDNELDECLSTCVAASCGDGFVHTALGEVCDDGDANSDTDADACRTTCELPSCGDGVIDEGEECDDANSDNDDGCSNICRLPGCGDGALQADEVCDDGNTSQFDACLNDCSASYCGDGFRQAVNEELCDDGNSSDDDTCTTSCTFGPTYVPCVDVPLGSTVGEPAYEGTTEGELNDFGAVCGFGAASEDVTLSWTAPTAGVWEFTTLGSTYDTVLHIYTYDGVACDGELLDCDDDGGVLNDSYIALDLAAGETVLIIVDGYDNDSVGDFVLNIVPQPE